MLRKVKYAIGPKSFKEGWFHQFGTRAAYNDNDSYISVTTAIIEDKETGEVKLVHPEDLQFVDEPPISGTETLLERIKEHSKDLNHD